VIDLVSGQLGEKGGVIGAKTEAAAHANEITEGARKEPHFKDERKKANTRGGGRDSWTSLLNNQKK